MKVEGEEEVSYAPAGGTPAVVEIAGGSAEPQKQETKGTNAKCRYAASVADLIADAKKNPAVPIVDKLLNRGDRLLIHGYEETYKSMFALELARSISTGKPFLGELEVLHPVRVGMIETEMRNPGLGERLRRMFPDPHEVANIKYLNEAGLTALRRTSDFSKRIGIIHDFLT